MKNSEKAVELFCEGYNCAQSVFGAFADEIGLDVKQALKMASPFGGGVGRLREVCGACSGMLMVFGWLYGYENAETGEVKSKLYEQTRKLCNDFSKLNGSIICREILDNAEIGGTPENRTEQYYAKRPCVCCVRTAAEIIEKYIAENKN